MFGLGASELLIILVIIVLLFGASKIPELGRSLGSGLKNFKDGLRQEDEPPPPAPRPAPPPASLDAGARPAAPESERRDDIRVEPRE